MDRDLLAVVYHPDFAASGYYVLRDRLAPAFEELKSRGCLDRPGVRLIEPRMVEEEYVHRVHSSGHVRGVVDSGYYDVAKLSAGAVAEGAEAVLEDRAAAAFCFTGTAGHHASRDGFWGFCYLNDVAIAVERLRDRHGRLRFSIIDIDPHYGDGTRDILGPDPGTLHVNFSGGYAGRQAQGPNNHDLYLPSDAGDDLFMEGVEDALRLVEAFRSDLLFVIFGHDNHADDYGAFELTDGFYPRFARRVRRSCAERVCYVLSGGSNPRVARAAVGGVVEVLSGDREGGLPSKQNSPSEGE